MTNATYTKFCKAEAMQARAYAAETAGSWTKALILHVRAEGMFAKIGEVSRAFESEMFALRCAEHA